MTELEFRMYELSARNDGRTKMRIFRPDGSCACFFMGTGTFASSWLGLGVIRNFALTRMTVWAWLRLLDLIAADGARAEQAKGDR